METGEARKMPFWYVGSVPLALSLSSSVGRSYGLSLDMRGHINASLCCLYVVGMLVMYYRGAAWTWLALASSAAVSLGLVLTINHPKPSFGPDTILDILVLALANTVVASAFRLLCVAAVDDEQRAQRRQITIMLFAALGLLGVVFGLAPLTLGGVAR